MIRCGMRLPKRIPAFTLAELLVVLVIAGILLTLSIGFTRKTQDTFVAQQFVKTLLLNARILRRKSMLISRNSADASWVHGIGFKLAKDESDNWELTQQKVLLPDTSSYYYRAYPDEGDMLFDFFQKIPDSTTQKLPSGLFINITPVTVSDSIPSAELACLKDLKAIFVIFESINGKMHAYCSADNHQIIPLGGGIAGGYQPNLTLSIMYADKTTYKTKVKILSNGEISSL